MPVAFLPSPSHGVWHLGPVPVRGYALCMVAGILLAVWAANRRYQRIGGPQGLILDVATWTVPCGLVGARLYNVITDYELYFGHGHDWLQIFQIWNGGLGIPGAIAGGTLGAWAVCRRSMISLWPVLGAAAPGMAFGLAIGSLGNWFSQQLYGRPSTAAWAVEIAPAHRVPGYENYATFQPLFAYESVWDIVVGLAVIWAARRFALSGDRVFALWVAAYATGKYGTESLRIDFAHYVLGLRVNQWLLIAALAAALVYLYLAREKRDYVPVGAGPPGRLVSSPGQGGQEISSDVVST
jgi:phosphatidylglycerol---prolipoprotein diacylglyceryl transferase